MPTKLSISEAASECGTKVFEISFVDENGMAVVPKAGLKWSLTKEDRTTIVNNKKDVAITPHATVIILLTGADLAMDLGNHFCYRYLVIEGTYDSSLGSDLPLKDHLMFPILDIAKVAP